MYIFNLLKLIQSGKIWITTFLFLLFYDYSVYAESHILDVGESVTISQEAYGGGYIDNVGLADFLDPHLTFTKNWDGTATITVKSYFDYTITVKLVFIERYRYLGHTRAATYYKNVDIQCYYKAPAPYIKPTSVSLPERIRVPINSERVYVTPVLEPYGATATETSWGKDIGTSVFTLYGTGSNDAQCWISGKNPGLGRAWVVIDNDWDKLYASTIIEVVDPNNLPPNSIFLPNSIEISVGGHNTLEPILVPENTSTSYTWESNNENVATVSYGKVTGKSEGTATINLKTANKLVATCIVNVVQSNGKDDEEDNNTSTIGMVGGYEYIDLGLSVKWATCNIGATKPEEFGSYYSWGEISEKTYYHWGSYSYGEYLTVRDIGSDIAGTRYDAATSKWGSDWRMPTEKEMGELISKCKFTFHTLNGIEGYLITGPNGSSIFLPDAGHIVGSDKRYFSYWTSTIAKDEAQGMTLYINKKNNSPTIREEMRAFGMPIRAVTDTKGIDNQDGIAIDATNFPDECFRNYLLSQEYGMDGILTNNEINNITALENIYFEDGIRSLKGIEFFTSLQELYLFWQSIGSLDISNNTNLTSLTCIHCGLNSLDVSQNTALVTLDCSANGGLTSLKVSPNSSLKNLYCKGTGIKGSEMDELINSLPLRSSNDGHFYAVYDTDYDRVRVTKNQVAAAKAKGWTVYYEDDSRNWIEYEGSDLVEIAIDATNFPDENFRNYLLEQNYGKDGVISENEIVEITDIYVWGEGISDLTGIEYFTALTSLFCSGNMLKSLNVSNNTALQYLNCSGCSLTELNVSKNTALKRIDCSGNKLTSLDVSNNIALTSLDCYNNQITGKAMDNLINSLPYNYSGENYINNNEIYIIRIRLNPNVEDGNVCTTRQVAALKDKGWMPYCSYYNPDNPYGMSWREYEGSDETAIIINATNFPDQDKHIYDIYGRRLSVPRKGINIIGGKKVVIK